MTDLQSQARVYVNGTLATGYVDFDISWSQSRGSLWELPAPGTGSVTFLYLQDTAVGIKYHDVIRVDTYTGVSWVTSFTGWVTDISVSYRAYGAAGRVIAVQADLTAASTALINANWVSSGATQSTAAAVAELMSQASGLAWQEWDPTQKWNQVGSTLTWTNVQAASAAITLINSYTITDNTAGGYQVTVPAGERSCWQDLQDLVIATGGYMYDGSDGRVWIILGRPAPAALGQMTLQSGYVETDLIADTRSFNVTNLAEITYNGGVWNQSNPTSVYRYGEQKGVLTTFLNSSSDAQTVGTTIIKGMSAPLLSITSLTVDITNPNMDDTSRDYLCQVGVFGFANPIVLSDAPTLAMGALSGLLLGYTRNITRDYHRVSMSLAPSTVYYNEIRWMDVFPSYTWTSYGTAFPTQKWSDV